MCPLIIYGQSKPVYYCKKTDNAINVDGKLDDKAWQNADKSWFVDMDGNEPRLKTWFKLTWDDQYLYAAFHVQDDHIWATMKKRDEFLWYENVVEFFIDPDGSPKSYAEFEINPLNTILDLYILNKYMARKDIYQLWEWNCKGMKSATELYGSLNDESDTDEYWEFEVALPFDQFYTAPNVPPVSGDVWMVDFCRGEGNERPDEREVSAWAPPAFHNPLSYGKLIFME